MAGSLALSGLASGVDTSSIVSQLMAVEGQGKTRLTTKQTQVSARESALKNIQTKLTALQTAATALTSSSVWSSSQTVDSSNSSSVGATILGSSAGAGATKLNVTALASAAQHAYHYDASSALTLQLQRPDNGDADSDPQNEGNPITIAANTSIADAVSKINAAGLGVTATAVTDESGEQTLVFAATSTGAAGEFSIGGLTGATNRSFERAGGDAAYTITTASGSINRTSTSNVVENAVPGVRLTLKAITDSPVTITVGSASLNTDAVKNQMQSYVNAYNALIDAVNGEVTEKTSKTDVTQGTLFGDTGLTGLVSGLRQLTSTDTAGALDSFADLGITTGTPGASSSSSKLGKLSLDTTKLSDLLATNPSGVKSAVATLSKRIADYATSQDKVLDARVDSADTEQRSLTDQLTEMDRQLALKQQRLEAQFTAMETALSQSQSMQAQLTSQIASLG